MAIKPSSKKATQFADESKSADFLDPASGNVHAFRAQGRGWFNKYPDFAANIHNANASLTNNATSKSNDDLYKTWLFVNAVQTGWKLAGETAQGQLGRIFYPRNLSQDELSIEGIVSSQYEFDKLVTFVEHHHFSQLRPQGIVAQSLDANSYPCVDFVLFKPANANTFDGFKPMHVALLIEGIDAGAERFKNMPTYVLTCKVAYDYWDGNYTLQQDIKSAINRKAVFGSASSPATTTNTTTDSSTVEANAYLDGQKSTG